jgi:hypothetical protein
MAAPAGISASAVGGVRCDLLGALALDLQTDAIGFRLRTRDLERES